MIIGFDGSRAFIEDKTGTENYSYQLLKALAKIDRKNQYIVYLRPGLLVIASDPELVSGERGNLDFKKNKDSHGTYHSGTSLGMTKGNWPNNFQFKEIFWPRLWTQGGLAQQTFKDQLDVLFIPSHTLPIIRKPDLKTVVTVHDLGSEYLPAMHQLKQRLYLGFMQKYQLKGATKIIAVSKATKIDLVKRIGIKPSKIEVIYEGYDQNLFKPVRNDVLVNGLIPFFLFVGTVQPRKNLERVIKAFSVHLRGETKIAASAHLGGGLKLVIAGSKGWLSDEIYDLPKKLGIESRVKFLGYVPDEKLPALYSGAIALVFPSLFEGFGLPILEAQASGCPVITSNVSSMPEVAGYVRVNRNVAGKGAILVDPYSIKEIVDAMIRLQGIGYREQLVKKGFDNIKRFSWEKCAEETLKVLESV